VPGTVTVAVAVVLVPQAPVHDNEYEVVAERAPVLWLPLVASAPLQPPEAVQEVAFVELHVSVDAPPPATVVGFADNVTVAAGTTLTVAVPVLLLVAGGTPAPPHAANIRDAPTGTIRMPVSQDLIVINHPYALQNCALSSKSNEWPGLGGGSPKLPRVQDVSSGYFIE
jgi:hypothetical protein